MKLRIGDILIAVLVLIIAVAIWVVPMVYEENGVVAIVSQDGKVIERVPLSQDKEISLRGCIVKTERGEIFVKETDCHDHVCEKTGRISKSGESIICVPNRISIKISGESSYDAVAG